MTNNLVRRHGVPALAFLGHDGSASWSCNLKILHSNSRFVVSLEDPTSVHGVNDKQLVTLRYEVLDTLARQGNPRPKALSLTLRAPCPVWYPRSFGKRVLSLHTGSHKLSVLAKATEVRIVFDANWLGKENLAVLQSVVERTGQLDGIPVDPQFVKSYQQGDWTIFNTSQDAQSAPYPPTGDQSSEPVPSIEDAVAADDAYDAPPPYAHASSKRPRTTHTSLTPDGPRLKRLVQDSTCPLSPTERATSTSSFGSESTHPSTATMKVDLFKDADASAVKKEVEDQFRDMVRNALLGMLAERSPSPSLSPTPRSSRSANVLKQHHRTPSRKSTLITTLVRTITEREIERLTGRILENASQHFSDLQKYADIEFEGNVDDIRAEFAIAKEDHIAACNEVCHEKMKEFEEELDQRAADFEAHIEEILVKGWDKADAVDKIRRGRGAQDTRSKLEQKRRATSLPL